MDHFTLESRRTFGYRDGWSYLDRWDTIGTAKATPAKQTKAPSSFDDGGRYVRWVTVKSRASERDITNALYQTFGVGRCTHEHDCCGCPVYYTSVIKAGRRVYRVITSVTYNY